MSLAVPTPKLPPSREEQQAIAAMKFPTAEEIAATQRRIEKEAAELREMREQSGVTGIDNEVAAMRETQERAKQSQENLARLKGLK